MTINIKSFVLYTYLNLNCLCCLTLVYLYSDISSAEAQDMAGIVVDCSDSFGRTYPGQQNTLLDIVKDILTRNILQSTNEQGLFPQHGFLGLRGLGGRRSGSDRSCDINSNGGYISAAIPTNWVTGRDEGWCMVEDWNGSNFEFGSAIQSIRDSLGGVNANDFTIIGKGLAEVLGKFKTFTLGRKRVLFITDGGESCNREASAGNDPIGILNKLNLLNDNRLTLWLVLFKPISQDDSDRMTRIVDAVNASNGSVSQADKSRLVIIDTSDKLEETVKNFRLSQIQPQRAYDACMSCRPTEQQKCDCCHQSNRWRDACPQNFCCSSMGACGPTQCCHVWTKCCDEYSCWDCCAQWVTHYCGEDHHPCTVKCGHQCHPCGPTVQQHGECGYNSCSYCQSAPHVRPNYCNDAGTRCGNYPPNVTPITPPIIGRLGCM